MVTKLNNSDIVAKASRGYVKDYYVNNWYSDSKTHESLMLPQGDLDPLLELMEDGTFNAEVNLIVDAILKRGFRIVSWDDESQRDYKKEKEFKKKYRAYKNFRQGFLNMVVYRNLFYEIVYKNKRPDELFVLETTEMGINVDEHGSILGYTQIPRSGTQTSDSVFFTPEECVHVAPSHISTNPWGFIDTTAIINIVKTKRYLETYIEELFRDNKFRNWWNIKNSSSGDQVKNFIDAIKQGKLFPEKDIVTEGEITSNMLVDTKILDDILRLYNQYKTQIREFFRVPPIMSGDVESSNRSSAEFQVRYAFDDNTIISWQQIMADEISNELFPKLGWSTHKLAFNHPDRLHDKESIEKAVQLKGLGYDNDTIKDYLSIEGVNLPKNAKLLEPVEEEPTDNKALSQDLQNKNAASRKPSDKSQINKKTADKVETRPDQIVGKAEDVKFSQYPYILE